MNQFLYKDNHIHNLESEFGDQSPYQQYTNRNIIYHKQNDLNQNDKPQGFSLKVISLENKIENV